MNELRRAGWASPGQGGVEHESERTQRCVSERAEATTPEWAARATPHV